MAQKGRPGPARPPIRTRAGTVQARPAVAPPPALLARTGEAPPGVAQAGGGGRGPAGPGAGGAASGDSCWGKLPIPPMPLISRGAPAFASAGDAKAANDDKPDSSWSTDKMPAWLAYDVSAAPEAQRGQVLISWYAIHAGCYID